MCSGVMEMYPSWTAWWSDSASPVQVISPPPIQKTSRSHGAFIPVRPSEKKRLPSLVTLTPRTSAAPTAGRVPFSTLVGRELLHPGDPADQSGEELAIGEQDLDLAAGEGDRHPRDPERHPLHRGGQRAGGEHGLA